MRIVSEFTYGGDMSAVGKFVIRYADGILPLNFVGSVWLKAEA